MKFRSMIIFFFCLTSASSVFAASGARNGADNMKESDNAAWFTGARAVSYCFEISNDFGLGLEESKEYFRDALRRWKQYVEVKMIPHSQPDSVAFNFSEVGSCGPSVDLTIYLGVVDNIVKPFFTPDIDTIGFAQQLSYDLRSGWGKGFIWIAPKYSRSQPQNGQRGFPDWGIPATLTALFMHELGHVYGVEHVPGTIMAADFTEWLELAHGPQSEPSILLHIDYERELVECYRQCPEPVRYIFSALYNFEKLNRSLTKVFGRSLVQPFSLLAFKRQRNGREFELRLNDGAGTESIAITSKPVTYWTEFNVFKVVSPDKSWTSHQSPVGVYLGVFKDKAGLLRNLVLTEENGLEIQLIDDPLKPEFLFQGVPR